MRIYIAGRMMGMEDHNFPAFEAAAKRLRDDGHFVINPVEVSAMFGSPEEIEKGFANLYGLRGCKNMPPWRGMPIATYEKMAQSIIDANLAAVRSCDAIYLLKGWESSRGAKKELSEAIAHGLTVMLEGDELT